MQLELDSPDPIDESPILRKARREMEVCNACRYCEGFCAVFPAMELRREFTSGDLNYLANLCHNCRGCYYACQYAPPHEFGINVPKTFAELRSETYAKYAWPRALAGLYARNGLAVALASAACLIGVMLAAILLQRSDILFSARPLAAGRSFYDVVPYEIMMGTALFVSGFSLVALVMGSIRFWRDAGPSAMSLKAFTEATRDATTLRYLGGGGHGCNDSGERFSTTRRLFHHAMALGFVLCFASTSVATLYHHLLGLVAPYAWSSLPVLLGATGGLGLVVGCSGLLWLKLTEDREPTAGRTTQMDVAFLILLLLVSLTGLLLLMVRTSSLMGITLVAHLGLVLALFLMLPYSKFVHALYRFGALLRYAKERVGKHNPD